MNTYNTQNTVYEHSERGRGVGKCRKMWLPAQQTAQKHCYHVENYLQTEHVQYCKLRPLFINMTKKDAQ